MHEADPKLSPRRQARQLFREAYRAQMSGDLADALRLYQASIDVCPTAEAYTFLGWTHSFRHDYVEALRCCHVAIEVDPTFGNPYNDIGAYLIELGAWDEAEPWLRAATRAPRYSSYHFPLYNLGRLYERRFDFALAERHYALALRVSPKYGLARRAVQRLRARAN